MAQPFSPAQRERILARLMEGARQYAIEPGMRKTSLDMLTAKAGISKSSFYKFFDSKEQLFLMVAWQWEAQILAQAREALQAAAGKSDKERAAAMVYAAFETIHLLGIVRFLAEDLPLAINALPKTDVHSHFANASHGIYAMLQDAQIHFTVPKATALAAIQMMYLSILHSGQIGMAFFPALRTLIEGACEKLVA